MTYIAGPVPRWGGGGAQAPPNRGYKATKFSLTLDTLWSIYSQIN